MPVRVAGRCPPAHCGGALVYSKSERCVASLAEYLLDGLPEGRSISGGEGAELADDESPFKGGEDGLNTEGLRRPAACHWPTCTSPRVWLGRSWLVTAITTTSGLEVL